MALSPNDRPSWSYRPFSMSPSALHFFSERINEKIWKRGIQWMSKRDILETDKQMHLTFAFHVQGCPSSLHTLWCSTSCWWCVTQGTWIHHLISMIELFFRRYFLSSSLSGYFVGSPHWVGLGPCLWDTEIDSFKAQLNNKNNGEQKCSHFIFFNSFVYYYYAFWRSY